MVLALFLRRLDASSLAPQLPFAKSMRRTGNGPGHGGGAAVPESDVEQALAGHKHAHGVSPGRFNKRRRVIAVVMLALTTALGTVAWFYGQTLALAMECIDMEDHVDESLFKPRVACVTHKQRTEKLVELVKTLSELLALYDIDYWIDSGTLLGQTRHQNVIPWDTDVDFGITQQGYEFLRDANKSTLSIPPGYQLQVYESEAFNTGDRDWHIPVRLVETWFGFYADVFVFYNESASGLPMLAPIPSVSWNECVKCVRTDRYKKMFLVPWTYIYPLISCPFAHFKVLCPARRSLYLAHLYGDDYRTPKRT